MKAADTVRIRLDEPARAALTQMMTILSGEGEHLSLIPSKIVSLVISDYAARYFMKEKGRLIEALLNRKTLLKAMLREVKDGSDEEIESLRAKLASLGQRRQRQEVLTKKRTLPPTAEKSSVESTSGSEERLD